MLLALTGHHTPDDTIRIQINDIYAYQNGRVLLSSTAAMAFHQKLNNPSEDVMAHRQSFLDGISKDVTFIRSDADHVIADIAGFDDSFLDMAEINREIEQ